MTAGDQGPQDAGSLTGFRQEFVTEGVVATGALCSWVAEPHLMERMTPRTPRHFCYRLRAAASPKSIPSRKSRSRDDQCQSPPVTANHLSLSDLQNVTARHPVFLETFSSKRRNTHGLHYAGTFYSVNFLTVPTQSNSLGLVIHGCSVDKSFLRIKNKKHARFPPLPQSKG